jgi:hypothetical protein
MAIDHKAVIAEIDQVLQRLSVLRGSPDDGYNDSGIPDKAEVLALIAAAIDRYAPARSRYRSMLETTLDSTGMLMPGNALLVVPGYLRALREDYAAGRLKSVTELIHADVFGDFLDLMAAAHQCAPWRT